MIIQLVNVVNSPLTKLQKFQPIHTFLNVLALLPEYRLIKIAKAKIYCAISIQPPTLFKLPLTMKI